MDGSRFKMLTIAAAAAGLLPFTGVHAQETTEPAVQEPAAEVAEPRRARSRMLDEMVVTAQKRDQDLQASPPAFRPSPASSWKHKA